MNEKNNPVAILNGDQVYLDELIRENARLTIQHEVDAQKMAECLRQINDLSAEIDSLVSHSFAREAADEHRAVKDLLAKAVADLHFIMAGGDPCKVCTVKCPFGEHTCKPVWRHEEEARL